MRHIVTFLVFGLCFFGMAIGLIFAKKVLKKGCATDPDDCACLEDGKDPSKCDQ